MAIFTMHVVVWTSGAQMFATPTGDIMEVIPLVATRPLLRSADWVRGIFNYRGSLVAMLDMPRLLGFGNWQPCMASRVLVVKT
jgi:chemotaxis signal transduction protein